MSSLKETDEFAGNSFPDVQAPLKVMLVGYLDGMTPERMPANACMRAIQTYGETEME